MYNRAEGAQRDASPLVLLSSLDRGYSIFIYSRALEVQSHFAITTLKNQVNTWLK